MQLAAIHNIEYTNDLMKQQQQEILDGINMEILYLVHYT